MSRGEGGGKMSPCVKALFGMLRIDPETVLAILTTTWIPDRISQTGTVIC